jgi:aminoglycoside phosphotransferase (APT) family kinase protein
MEFVNGRIYTDYSLPDMTPSDRRKAWLSLVSTLARLHAVDYTAIGLEGFGKPTGMYTRHCNTYTRIEAEQALVKDQHTGKPLGRAHEHFDEIVAHIRNNPPEERTAIVHGDYKFDNVVSQKSHTVIYEARR